MSCRNCVDGCGCVVLGSTGVLVTGSGNNAAPYVVSVDLCTLINALPQQNREIAANEWIVAQDATGNCIQVRAPADINVQSLSFNGATNVLTLTETDGSVFNVSLASTFTETTTTITYDPGTASWTYTNEVGAVFTLDLCTQLNDLTVAGATNSGDLMVVADPTNAECKLAPIPAPGGSGTVTNVTATDTNSLGLNVTNGTTTPNITGFVRRAFFNDSGLGEGANGIYVRTSANTLNSTTDNLTLWPSFDGPDGGGTNCVITTRSQRIVRDTNGVLYGEPRYGAIHVDTNGPSQTLFFNGVNQRQFSVHTHTVVNNLFCRTLLGRPEPHVRCILANGSPGELYQYFWDGNDSIYGAVSNGAQTVGVIRAGTPNIGFRIQPWLEVNIPPGDTYSFNIRPQFNNNGNGSPSITFEGRSVIRCLYVTR